MSSKSKSNSIKAKQAKQLRKPQPKDGELADDALDQVAGGGGSPAEVSDISTAMQLDLQDAVGRQQQAFQTLSKIQKASHDTTQSIIKNLK